MIGSLSKIFKQIVERIVFSPENMVIIRFLYPPYVCAYYSRALDSCEECQEILLPLGRFRFLVNPLMKPLDLNNSDSLF